VPHFSYQAKCLRRKRVGIVLDSEVCSVDDLNIATMMSEHKLRRLNVPKLTGLESARLDLCLRIRKSGLFGGLIKQVQFLTARETGAELNLKACC